MTIFGKSRDLKNKVNLFKSPGVLANENDGGAGRTFTKTPLKGTRLSFYIGCGFEFIDRIYSNKRHGAY